MDARETHTTSATRSPARAGHVLLIDDDEVDIMGFKRACRLNQIDNPVLIARDGIEALAMLRGDGCPPVPRPCVVLLDLNLPRMSGLEFLRELRADAAHRRAVVFVLTTSTAEVDRMAAYDLGISGYIVKARAGSSLVPVVELLRSFWNIVEVP